MGTLQDLFGGVAGAHGDTNLAGKAFVIAETLDASGSMAPYRDAVIQGFNDQLAALKASEDAEIMRISTSMFNVNSTLLHDYVDLDSAGFDDVKYTTNNGTALWDAALDAMEGVERFRDELAKKGTQVRRATVIVYTDGGENSSKCSVEEVRAAAKRLLDQECRLVLFGFGVDAKAIAAEMGFPPEDAVDINTDAHNIRIAIGTKSAKVITS